MIVVADTSPINYLVLIGQVQLLPRLYGRLILPATVSDELLRTLSPESVTSRLKTVPDWLSVQSSSYPLSSPYFQLDAGESEAIALAEELGADRLLIDETLGRVEARRRGIPVIGTLGILREAHVQGILQLPDALAALQTTSFHITPALIKRLLDSI